MTDATNLEAAFARLEGVVTTEIKHLAHDVKNITAKLDAYPTKRDLDAVSLRVDGVDERIRWAWRTGIVFAASVVGSAITAWIKLVH